MRETQRVDLHMLTLLEDLRRTGSVTETAQRHGLTQSGASRVLSRLRAAFDDPLFVAQGHRLRPTPRCDALAPALSRCLEASRALFAEPGFDAAAAEGQVHLGVPDHLAYLFGPMLLERLTKEAPGLELVFHHFSRDWGQALREGELDLAFGVLTGREANLRRRWLMDDPWHVLVRKGHSVLRKTWCAQTFSEGDHGVMTVTGRGSSHVDRALAKLGLRRRIAVRATSPLVVAMMAAESALRVTTTRRLAESLARRLPLQVLDLPLEADPLRLPLVWHERQHHEPRHQWLRGVVGAVFNDAA